MTVMRALSVTVRDQCATQRVISDHRSDDLYTLCASGTGLLRTRFNQHINFLLSWMWKSGVRYGGWPEVYS
jgi:hypothetical protein